MPLPEANARLREASAASRFLDDLLFALAQLWLVAAPSCISLHLTSCHLTVASKNLPFLGKPAAKPPPHNTSPPAGQ
jgi:hypothetical protein